MAEDNDLASLKAIIAERDRFYLNMFASQDASIKTAFISAEKALDKAELASAKRFDSVNEMRAMLNDMVGTFARLDVVNTRFLSIDEKINELLRWRESQKGRGGALHDVWGWIVAVVMGALGFLAYFSKGQQ